MGRRMLFAALAMSLFMTLTGCSNNKDAEERNDEGAAEMTLSGLQESGKADNTGIEVIVDSEMPYADKYYKVEMKEVPLEQSDFIRNLIEGLDNNEITQENTAEGTQNSAIIDGVEHKWIYNKNNLIYFTNDESINTLPDEENMLTADKLAEKLNLKTTENPIVKKEDGLFTVEYSFEYEGTGVLGNKKISVSDVNGGESIKGEYMSITLSNEGIQSLEISNILEPLQVLEEYDPSRDMIDENRLKQILAMHYQHGYGEGEQSITGNLSVEHIEVLYVPMMEKEKNNMIPILEVEVKSDIDKDIDTYTAYIDAVSGFVYTSY